MVGEDTSPAQLFEAELLIYLREIAEAVWTERGNTGSDRTNGTHIDSQEAPIRLAHTRNNRAHHIEQFMVCALGDGGGLHGRGTVKRAREQM
jgi:hypothetical protein